MAQGSMPERAHSFPCNATTNEGGDTFGWSKSIAYPKNALSWVKPPVAFPR